MAFMTAFLGGSPWINYRSSDTGNPSHIPLKKESVASPPSFATARINKEAACLAPSFENLVLLNKNAHVCGAMDSRKLSGQMPSQRGVDTHLAANPVPSFIARSQHLTGQEDAPWCPAAFLFTFTKLGPSLPVDTAELVELMLYLGIIVVQFLFCRRRRRSAERSEECEASPCSTVSNESVGENSPVDLDLDMLLEFPAVGQAHSPMAPSPETATFWRDPNVVHVEHVSDYKSSFSPRSKETYDGLGEAPSILPSDETLSKIESRHNVPATVDKSVSSCDSVSDCESDITEPNSNVAIAPLDDTTMVHLWNSEIFSQQQVMGREHPLSTTIADLSIIDHNGDIDTLITLLKNASRKDSDALASNAAPHIECLYSSLKAIFGIRECMQIGTERVWQTAGNRESVVMGTEHNAQTMVQETPRFHDLIEKKVCVNSQTQTIESGEIVDERCFESTSCGTPETEWGCEFQCLFPKSSADMTSKDTLQEGSAGEAAFFPIGPCLLPEITPKEMSDESPEFYPISTPSGNMYNSPNSAFDNFDHTPNRFQNLCTIYEEEDWSRILPHQQVCNDDEKSLQDTSVANPGVSSAKPVSTCRPFLQDFMVDEKAARFSIVKADPAACVVEPKLACFTDENAVDRTV